MLDYEGEIAVMIGREGRRIAECDAWKHIAGYACYNGAWIRDWQRHTQQWVPGKNFWHTVDGGCRRNSGWRHHDAHHAAERQENAAPPQR